MTTHATVHPFQVWADNDKRCSGRTVRVDEVDDRFAYCTVLTPREGSIRTGHRVRIAINRMRPTATGYRLIEETPANE
ncbi:hypothetical protein GCM10022224_104170 [Nonomuraea antimicrobica]|uniref:TRAM domain-containing protein n=1 Tax=Nonomuraea antimicrobica TaxID=561173 RepID=A0ABP7ER72_9ACTN